MASPFIPYGKQCIDQSDIDAVVEVLRSDWLTTGPNVQDFEQIFAEELGVGHGIAVSSGTAALHAAMFAAGIGVGDEVVVPSMTFAATANAVVYQGGRPVFSDVSEDSLLVDPDSVERLINEKTKAIVAVDYAGQFCDYERLRQIVDRYGLVLVSDACHSLGAQYGVQSSGFCADMSVFSFHPVKPITCGEGGMVATDNADYAKKIKSFRNHGISTDHHQRAKAGGWAYEMEHLGYNYRLNDIQCVLGASQLKKLPEWIKKRRAIADKYDKAFSRCPGVRPLGRHPGGPHGYHLYVVRVSERDKVFAQMREVGIGVNVHYKPVHLHSFYRSKFGTGEGLCPNAEKAYDEIISLPIYPTMTDEDVDRVIEELTKATSDGGLSN